MDLNYRSGDAHLSSYVLSPSPFEFQGASAKIIIQSPDKIEHFFCCARLII